MIGHETAVFIAHAILAVAWGGAVACIALAVGWARRRRTRRVCSGCSQSAARCMCAGRDWA